MIVVSGTFEVAASDIEEAIAAAQEMAEASRLEAGCVSYEFFRDLEPVGETGRFRVFEEWLSDEALKEHFATPHMERFLGRIGGLDIRSRAIKRYRVAEVTDL